MIRRIAPCALALAVSAVPLWSIAAEDAPAPPPATAPATQPRPEPKALSDNVKRGLEWLAKQQNESGSWSEGEESAQMRQSRARTAANVQGDPVATTAPSDPGNVADSASAILALYRAGSTTAQGPYAANIIRGLGYICDQVEKSDSPSLWVTDARNTRLQSKLGTYVDTFLAAQVLAETRPTIADATLRGRVDQALAKTLEKIERNQQKDGGWKNEGWAPALAQGLASKSINRAAQTGANVNEDVRKNAERYARSNFNASDGSVSGGGGAGVELYTRSSNVQMLNDSDITNVQQEGVIRARLAAPTTRPGEQAQLLSQLKSIEDNRADLQAATQAVVARLADEKFVAGFGSNGGEEFLSHMNIGEALLARGGDEWNKWDKSMTENMSRIQNDDGSWSGHHCITGKTFCTSSALMVLMVDRAPMPLATNPKATTQAAAKAEKATAAAAAAVPAAETEAPKE